MISQAYMDLLAEMGDLHKRKNAGYAGQNPDAWANFRLAERLGVSAATGVFVRMTDKWMRFLNLFGDAANEQVGESLTDTLIDLAAYSLIAVCLLREKPTELHA